MSSELPPTYERECPEGDASDVSGAPPPDEPQMLIMPATDALRFQQGYLGADGERAAIEGELQVKCAQPSRWRKLTMHLRTTESTAERTIELAHTAIVLYDADAADDPEAPFPSSFPFAIPLTADTPQCIHTPQSALAHVLSATLHPADRTAPPLTKALAVHTRRFSSHTHTPAIAPVTRSIDAPARVDVEVPRTTFTAHEPVPIYVTVPSPSRELVVQGGLRLRNIKAELVRTVRVRQGEPNDDPCANESEDDDDDEEDGGRLPLGVSHEQATEPSSSSSQATARRRAPAAVYKTVVSRSGALCRFHTSLPVRLRFVLHQSSPASSPSDPARPLPAGEFGLLDSDAECGSITQATLLHAVAFRLRVHVTFRNIATRTEHVSTLALPLTFLPPPAPLPELEAGMDSAYHKKHDRPPARTVRGDDPDAAPHYEEGEAGPSAAAVVVASGEPPPFEERDAPPSFAEASTSSRLPTFLESEQEIYVPPSSDDDDGAHHHIEPSLPPPPSLPPSLPAPQPRHVIDGEGVLFGFPASAHFDGHAEDVDRARAPTPPPTLEMATHDPDVTGLADLDLDMDLALDLDLDLDAPGTRAMQALGLGIALEQREETTARGPPPPPPPPMDDPSDPPPSIHSEYRSREGVPHQMPGAPASSPPPPHRHRHHHHRHSPPPPLLQSPAAGEGGAPASAHAHAPPPYLIPDDEDGEGGHEHVARPPPYVDVMHEH